MYDILLCTIPKHGVNVPPLALAYLQGVCKANNFTVDVKDFNLELWENTIYTKWWNIWKESDETLYRGKNFYQFYNEFYKEFILQWAIEIANHPSNFVGISCFSYRSLPTLKFLVPEIKKINPNKKIIVGGSPIYTYYNWILSNNLADYTVSNEGEIALIEILKEKHLPGHIIIPQLENLNNLPLPDYTGLNFLRYIPKDPGGLRVLDKNYKRESIEAGIMGSRGCVRKCTFCDVETFYPRFRWRSAEHIYKEMLYLLNLGINHIYFFDSLINGNQKELENLCDLIINNGSKFESIKGLGIIKNMPERIYEKMKKANFKQIMIGIESFSPKLRTDMNKGFTDELLKQNLNLYAKYKINVALLLIVGYPTQTEEDHLEEYKWMKENQHYAKNPITRIEIGGTMLILPGAPVFKKKMYKLFLDSNKDWVSFPTNEANNMQVRVRRRNDIERWAKEFGFKVGSTYGEGGQIIGDPEKNNIADYKRPQDDLVSIYHSDTDTEDEQEFKKFIGWESDPSRPTHSQQ